MAGNVHGQFQATPDTELVKNVSQMILDDLFAGAHDPTDLAVGQPFPDQDGNLNLFGG
jgi:hypothetical protein